MMQARPRGIKKIAAPKTLRRLMADHFHARDRALREVRLGWRVRALPSFLFV